MGEVIRVIQFGLGPIGSAIARLISERENLELVGAVDIDPGKIGSDVGELLGLGRAFGIEVKGRLADVESNADIVVHTTNSYFDQFLDQILEILEAGFDIVSTSEELSFPWRDNAEQAAMVDVAARNAGRTVLGTGVNPGFLMDALPLFISSISQRVDHVDVTRVINASRRRGPFQAKIGCGMTADEFKRKMAAGRMGHVGMPQSAAMLFGTLGKELVRFENVVEPVLAATPVKSDFFDVPSGGVRGLHQTGRGYAGDGEFVSLTFRAALDEEPDGDTITISGHPDITVTLQGTNGDLATVAMAVNAIRRVKEAGPGLVTMRDIPIVTGLAGMSGTTGSAVGASRQRGAKQPADLPPRGSGMRVERDSRVQVAKRGFVFSWSFYSLFLIAVLGVAAASGVEPLLFGLPRWVALACIALPAAFVAVLVPLVEKLIPDIPLADEQDPAS